MTTREHAQLASAVSHGKIPSPLPTRERRTRPRARRLPPEIRAESRRESNREYSRRLKAGILPIKRLRVDLDAVMETYFKQQKWD